jgi:DHA2 family multidrug resistance protein
MSQDLAADAIGPAGRAAPPPRPSPPPPAPPAGPPRLAFPPLEGNARVLGTVALSLATFMNVLDSSIANVSIPAIAGDMGVSTSQGTWIITSFGVANAISVPLTGWLSQRFGQVRLFTGSVLLFVLASWLCGLAPNFESLVFFRVLQGLVAGPMVPLSQTLLLASYPPALAGTAMAMWAMTTLVAPVAGPLLGGWITDNVAWPWIFYINIPVGLMAAAMTWSIYRSRDPGPRRVPLDWVGLGLLVLWVGALQIMIDKGKELDWFASDQIVILAVVAVVGFAFFLAWVLTESHPIVNLRFFARRNFTVGALTLSVAYGLFFGNVVLLPLWLQQWMGYTATWAGLVTAPVGLLAIVLSPWVGKNVSRIDPRKLTTVAFLGFGLVLWMRSQFNLQAPFETILIPTLLQGAAMAFFFIPLQAIVFNGMRPDEMPSAAGLSNFMRMVAGAMGTSIFTTLWESRAVLHHAHLAEAMNPGNSAALQAMAQLTAAGQSQEQAAATLMRLLDQQAYTMAVTDLFYLSSAVFLLLIGAVWLARPKTAPQGPGAPGGGAH